MEVSESIISGHEVTIALAFIIIGMALVVFGFYMMLKQMFSDNELIKEELGEKKK
jgi:hypothetical protein